MAEEKVMVTLLRADGAELGDYELPANRRVERLLPVLVEALCRYSLGFERSEITLCLDEPGGPVPIKAGETLASCGVTDGRYLRVMPGRTMR